MKKLFLLLLVCFSMRAFAQLADDDHRILNEFIVLVQAGHTVKDITATNPSLTVKRELSKRMNIWLLERNTITGADEFLNTLRQNEHVKLAQFNSTIQQRSALVPDDPFFNLQWNMQNTGQGGGTAGVDIGATDAWGINHSNLTANGDSIVVAVIDVSFDATHEDLNFYVNNKEIPGNDIDDDNNGYIDDYEGWNANNSSGNIHSSGADPHSMHIAGIIGAIGNNKVGVAGVCWGVKIMRVCGSGGNQAVVVAAYDYVLNMRSLYNNTAGAKGAFIVATNTSFGVDNGNPINYPIWCALYDSMGAAGILSAGATNNGHVNVDQAGDIPTTCPSKWLITVTSTDHNDILQAGYGKNSIDLGAPGMGIYSTYPSNAYAYLNGTSMATPHVTGTIAAMFAAACPKMIDDYYAYPDSIALIVKQMILDGATRTSSLHNITVTGGRLNLYNAIRNLREYNCNSCNYEISTGVEQPKCNNSCDGSIAIQVSGGSNFGFTETDLCPGFYPITLTDSSGCVRVKNVQLYKPDPILITSVETTTPHDTIPGNIILAVNAGQYAIEYSLDGINYQSTSTFAIDSTGEYTVYIRNETGCVIERTVDVFALGINDVSALGDWNIYPNPATDVLNITLELAGNMPVQFSITNILGELILQQTKDIGPGVHTATIPLSAFPGGIYFLSVNAGGLATKKFVIAR